MRTLAALGADPRLPNVENSTPLMARPDSPRALPARTPARRAKCWRPCRSALDLGADINAVDNNGETAMHGAAYKNLPKVVKFLAAKGAKIDVWNRDDKFGWTPLAIAAGYRFGNFKPSPDTEAARPRSDDRRRRHSAEDRRRQDPADLLARSSPRHSGSTCRLELRPGV